MINGMATRTRAESPGLVTTIITTPPTSITRFLSACETAIGNILDGDGSYGMQQGLLLSGTRTTVGSYWPVKDEATSMLMESLMY